MESTSYSPTGCLDNPDHLWQRPLPSHTRSVANREDSAESRPNRYARLCDKPLQTRSLWYVESRSPCCTSTVSARGKVGLVWSAEAISPVMPRWKLGVIE